MTLFMKMESAYRVVQGFSVALWVAEGSGAILTFRAQGIGVLNEMGELVAGVAYDGWTKTNCFCHHRIEKPFVSREYWRAIMEYPFNQLGLSRISALAESTNLKAIKVNKHLGATVEATLKGASDSGDDMLVFVLWKADAKPLKWRHHEVI